MKIKSINTNAAILHQLRKPLIIDSIKLPSFLSKGQVLVELTYSGICGSQIGEIDGVKGPDKYLPHLLGHEGIGYVVEVGPQVSKISKGDKVLLHWMKSKGIESNVPIYEWKSKKLNAGLVTTFNNHAIVSENRVTKIINNLNDLDYLLLGCTASTAIGSIFKLSNVKKNNLVAVSGCGPIGLYIIKVLKYLKVKNIIAIDINQKKLNFAKQLGANLLINLKTKSFKSIKSKYSNGIDYFFECSGSTKVISQAFKHLNKNGSEILIGVPSYKKMSEFYTLDINLGKKLVGSKGGNFNPDKDLKSYINLINKKVFKNKNIIKNKINLNQLNDLIYETKKGHIVGKSIIVY